jgi:PAS domain S-box-containing protein
VTFTAIEQLLFESNPHPMWVFDIDSMAFLAVNQAALSMYGYSRDEFLRMTTKDIYPTDDTTDLLRTTYSGSDGLKTVGTWRHVTKDGTLILAEIASHDMKWGGRHARLVLATHETARQQAEDSLRAERDLLRTLIDTVPDLIYVKDAASRFVVANRAVTRFLGGRKPDDLVGKADSDFFPKELAAIYFSDERAVIRSGQALVGRIEASVDPKGDPRWLSTSKVPWRDSQGQTIGIIGIGRDITEYKRSQDALRESDQALKALVDASPVGIICTDSSWNVTLWNPAAERIFGWSEKENLGRPFSFVPENVRKAYKELRASVFEGEIISNYEMRARRRDGSEIDVLLSMAPLRDAAGKVQGVIDIVVDPTQAIKPRRKSGRKPPP